MPNLATDPNLQSHATSGEILVGAIWLAGYCLVMILATLSGNFGSIATAVNIAGLY
jgi:hypothetical protein